MNYYNLISIMPKGAAYDADAQAFITATGISGTNANAINQLVLDLKAANIWTKMKAIYPMVGGTATTHKFNLKDSRDLNAAFRLSFVGGWTHSANGATPNGTNGYADSFLVPSAFYSTNMHLSYYSRTSTIGVSQEIGSSQISGPTNYSTLATARNSIYGQTTNGLINFVSQANSLGFFIGEKLTNSSRKVFRNGIVNNSTVTTDANALPNRNIYIGALNDNGTTTNYSSKQCAFASIGDGLTDLESQLFYQITEKYQVALSRNINTTQSFYYNSAYNNETNAFLFSTQITDNTIQTATNTLVNDLKTANIWTKMKAVYPMVGGTATTHKFNLINAQDTDAAFRLNFVGGGTHSANGYQPGGVNGYANTFLTPSTHLSLNSAHLSFYSRTNSTGNFADMGVANNSTNLSAIHIISKWSDNRFYGQVNDYDFTDNTVADSLGFFCGSRTASNVQKTFKNGSIVTSKTVASTLLVGYSIPIGARYIQNVAGSPGYTSYSNRQCAFATIGDGLSDAEALSLYNAVQTFQTTLGRQV